MCVHFGPTRPAGHGQFAILRVPYALCLPLAIALRADAASTSGRRPLPSRHSAPPIDRPSTYQSFTKSPTDTGARSIPSLLSFLPSFEIPHTAWHIGLNSAQRCRELADSPAWFCARVACALGPRRQDSQKGEVPSRLSPCVYAQPPDSLELLLKRRWARLNTVLAL